MINSSDRILTTHIGSLIRPPRLSEILRMRELKDGCDDDTYLQCLSDSVVTIVRQQAEAGIDIVSDGEFGKSHSWSRYILDRLAGFEIVAEPRGKARLKPRDVVTPPGADKRRFPEFYADYDKTQGFTHSADFGICTGPVKYSGLDLLQRDIANFKAALAKVGVTAGFLPVVAPASVEPFAKDQYYGNEEKYLFAIAEALGSEYRAIVDAGLMVQIDDAVLALTYDGMVPPGTLEEYRRWAELRIAALNHALEGIPEERSRYHVCWGSWNAPHTGDVAFKDIVDLILKVRVGGYAFEQANPRHEHEWRVWETVALPQGKVLLPGIISHATNVVEHPELVAERITRLALLVGRENVIGSTDCGFAQGPFVQRVHPSIMWAKLEALAEGARLATQKLWGH